jgi:branched-chain amino acid transport system ATP-binding protein
MGSTEASILELHDVSKNFGGVKAVHGLTISMKGSDILGLIGPNGAGKTTVFNLMTGVFPLTSGSIFFDTKDISNLPAHRIVESGIARTYQNIRLFESMTVYEHIKFGQNCRIRSRLHWSRRGNLEKSLKEEAEDILNFLGIRQLGNVPAHSLPYGQQRRVEIARALASQPRLLLLDEPTAGMNVSEKKEVLEIMRKLHEKGIAILVIEHDMRVVRHTCNKIIMLNFGEKIAEGSPAEIYRDIKAREVYFGKE